VIVLPVFNGSVSSYSTIDKHAANANGIVQRNALCSDYVEGSGNRAGIAVSQAEQFEPNCCPETAFVAHAPDLLVDPRKSALSGEIANFQRLELPEVEIVTASRRSDSAGQSAVLFQNFQEVSHSIVEFRKMVQDETQVFFPADLDKGIS